MWCSLTEILFFRSCWTQFSIPLSSHLENRLFYVWLSTDQSSKSKHKKGVKGNNWPWFEVDLTATWLHSVLWPKLPANSTEQGLLCVCLVCPHILSVHQYWHACASAAQKARHVWIAVSLCSFLFCVCNLGRGTPQIHGIPHSNANMSFQTMPFLCWGTFYLHVLLFYAFCCL